ncbi:MAG: TonB-dependent receptor plug domain-containing protein [Chitinophagaceae bacterium]|nr:TonB-dependent receptor plug domain-containing protein [Chitinophagaceae bacterium]
MNKRKIILCFVILFCGYFSNAQNKDSVFKEIELSSIIIKSYTELEKRIEPSATILFPSFIKKINTGMDIPFILNSTPSVQVNSDAGTGIGYSNIQIRGTDVTRINVSMNGISINDAESQGTFFVNFPDIISSAKSIKIERGVGLSKAGTGNFGGAISINNLDIANEKPSFYFATDVGSFNTLRNTLKLGTGLINDKFNSTLRLSRIVSNGYIDRSASDLKSIQWTTLYKLNSKTNIVFNYLGGKEKTGQAWNGVSEENLNTNRTFNELGLMANGNYYENQTDNYQQDYFQFFVNHDVNKYWKTSTVFYLTKGKGYYEEYKQNAHFQNYNLPNFVSGNDTIDHTNLIRQLWLDNNFYGIKYMLQYQKNNADLGIYLNASQYKGTHFGKVIWADYGIDNNYKWYDVDAMKNEISMATMYSYKLKNTWQFFADAQLRKVDYKLNGFRNMPNLKHDLNFLFFNPKVEIRYVGFDKTSFSFQAGIAQKEPNRNDIEVNNNQLPKAEKMLDVELNMNHKMNKFIMFNATLFWMQYKDQLVLNGKINDVGAYTRVNIDNSFRRGIEFETQIKILKKLSFSGNVSLMQHQILNYTDFVDDYDNGGQLETKFSNTQIAFSPNFIFSGQLNYVPFTNSKFSISWFSKFIGKQYLDNTQNENRKLNSFLVNDIILYYPIQVANSTINFRGAIYNLLNKKYESGGYTYSYFYNNNLTTQNYFYPQSGIRFMLGFDIGF